MLIVVAIITCVIGYGYRHSSTHASFSETIPKAEIIFLDSAGRRLANGITDDQYNYVPLIHPEVGDCHEIEKSASSSKEARQAWQECFEHLSTWIPNWAGKVSQVAIKAQGCSVNNIPVAA